MAETAEQLPDRSRARLDRAIVTARTIALMLAMSVATMVLVGTLVIQAGASPEDVATYRVPLIAVAFGALVGSVMVRRLGLTLLRLELAHATGGDEGLAGHLVRTSVVSSALGEVVGIAGLVLGVMTGDSYTMYALCGASLVAILFSLPRANGWREAFQQIVSRARPGAEPAGASAANR